MARKTKTQIVFSILHSPKKTGSSLFWTRLYFSIILGLCIFLSAAKAQARTVRVGIYDNPPKVQMEKAGTPCGIFIDILEYIAECEGWKIHYISGTWDEGLTRLEKNDIDIMVDVAFSAARNQRFDFNQITVISSWLQIFSRKDLSIPSVSALEGKKVAVLKGSIQEEVSHEISKQFGLTFTKIPLPDYGSTVQAVLSGTADAVIVSRFYGYRKGQEDGLVPTPVILYPTTLHFAALKGKNRDLLLAIDKHMAKMMNDPHSVYYRSLVYWLMEKPRMFIPRFVIWSIVSITAALFFFSALSLVLKWQVRRRTKELEVKNKELTQALQELKTARDAAIKRERLYAFGQLACGVAHDFNNLLVPIVNYTNQMLANKTGLEDREKLKVKLEAINTAGKHGAEIIRRMQQFYRSFKDPAVKERVDLNNVIREVIGLLQGRLDKIAVEAVLNLGTDSEIVGRISDMHEMLLNLVLNALDAMPKGGRLEISTNNTTGLVSITIQDSGTGMSEEIRKKCLEPFFTTKGEKGTGMGLTMVNNLVTEYGGQMEIKTAPGTGTTFILTFLGA